MSRGERMCPYGYINLHSNLGLISKLLVTLKKHALLLEDFYFHVCEEPLKSFVSIKMKTHNKQHEYNM